MKTEKKRYYLIEYCGIRRREYDSKEELNAAFERIRKYNKRTSAKFITGNMSVKLENGKYVLYAHVYRKLREKSTITDLDNYTSNFDERSLIFDVYDNLVTANPEKNSSNIAYYPDINIAYFEDINKNNRTNNDVIRRIKYIPVLYNEDLKYLNREYISKCVQSHCYGQIIDFEFFEGILREFGDYRHCDYEYDNLLRSINKVKYEGYDPSYLYYDTMNFYKSFVNEREKDGSLVRDQNGKYQVSRRRARDFGFYVKNYHARNQRYATSYTFQNSKTKLSEMKALREQILKYKEQESNMTLKKTNK